MKFKKQARRILSVLKQFLGKILYTLLFLISSFGKKTGGKSAVIIHMHTKGRHIPFLARIVTCFSVEEIRIVRSSCLALFQSLYRMRFKTDKSIRVCSVRKIPAENREQDYLALITSAGIKKLLIFSYDYFNLFEAQSQLPIRYLPFYMSQRFYEDKEDIIPSLNELAHKSRKITLGFAGAVNKQGYSQKAMFPLLDRYHIVELIKTHFHDSVFLLTQQSEKSNLYSSKEAFKFAITFKSGNNPSKYPLTPEEYIGFLSECNFFLALPGVTIPHAHNIIEAMRIGAIPIFNYNKYFHPPLKNGYNCLTFNTEAELLKILRSISRMPKEKIATMRKKVLITYEKLLAPQAIAPSLEKKETDEKQILFVCSSIETISLKTRYKLS